MKIFIVTGQTATGKTNLALELAKKHNGELINCDSRQIYKHLDIVTGKDIAPNSQFTEVKRIDRFSIGFYVIQNIPIWLYDIADPKEYFSSFDFQTCALDVIKAVLARGKTPIIVGGTYFYLRHLLYDIETEHIKPNWELRKSLEQKTITELQTLLQEKNNEIFEQMNESDNKNPQRLIRKIEIAEANSSNSMVKIKHDPISKLSRLLKVPAEEMNIEFIGKSIEKESLISAIHARVEKRIAHSAIEEVKKLLHHGYTKEDAGLQTIGYTQLIQYVEGIMSLEQAKEEWITREIQYAKRQLTFMKKDPHIIWQ